MRGLGPGHQGHRVEPEWGVLAVQFLHSCREDGHCAQADPETNLDGHERSDGVHLWESQKQSSTSGASELIFQYYISVYIFQYFISFSAMRI